MNAQLQSLRELVSPRTGILKSLALRPRSADQPVLPVIYEGVLSNYDFRKASAPERATCGKGLTEEIAMLGAIGEAIERYCAAHVGSDLRRDTTIAVKEEKGEGAIAAEEFVLYSEEQRARPEFPYWRHQPQDAIVWTTALELPDQNPVLVPAAFVYLNPVGDQPQDYFFGTNSSGYAAGPDVAAALRTALLELIERDAFTLTWLARRPAMEIDLQSMRGPHAATVTEIHRTYARWGTTIRAFALQTNLPATVVMAIALDETGDGPAAIVGLGCELEPASALRKALFEICQMHEPLRRRCAEQGRTRLDHYTDVHTLEDHAAYFFRQDHRHELDFLLNASGRIAITDFPDHSTETILDDLNLLQRAFAALGYRAVYRDLTTPDLQAYPIRVVRALVTQLQPISFGHGLQRLAGKRLKECGAEALNPCPHPLA